MGVTEDIAVAVPDAASRDAPAAGETQAEKRLGWAAFVVTIAVAELVWLVLVAYAAYLLMT